MDLVFRLSFILFLILIPALLRAECLEGDCQAGQGTASYFGGMKYSGAFKDGKPNGQGTKTYQDQTTYTGTFKEGKFEGKGQKS